MRSTLIACAATLVMGATANAQQLLAAGSLYGGPAQARAVCYFYNAGSSTSTLTNLQIVDQNGTVSTLIINQCSGGQLFAGRSCGIAANVANNATYSCSGLVAPSKSAVRGILEMRDINQVTLQNIELR